jgi:hypothetical protein
MDEDRRDPPDVTLVLLCSQKILGVRPVCPPVFTGGENGKESRRRRRPPLQKRKDGAPSAGMVQCKDGAPAR